MPIFWAPLDLGCTVGTCPCALPYAVLAPLSPLLRERFAWICSLLHRLQPVHKVSERPVSLRMRKCHVEEYFEQEGMHAFTSGSRYGSLPGSPRKGHLLGCNAMRDSSNASPSVVKQGATNGASARNRWDEEAGYVSLREACEAGLPDIDACSLDLQVRPPSSRVCKHCNLQQWLH